MSRRNYFIINGITVYRIIAAPVLVILIFTDQQDIFKWLLAFSYFTDLIDGMLARKFHVTSIRGAWLDSIGDDLTIIVSMIGLFKFHKEFVQTEQLVFICLFSLFFLQLFLAFFRYHKFTTFHTYFAKLAAFLQGTFFILFFLLNEPIYILFYMAVVVTAIELIEEIILVLLLPKWQANVKGLYWVLTKKIE